MYYVIFLILRLRTTQKIQGKIIVIYTMRDRQDQLLHQSFLESLNFHLIVTLQQIYDGCNRILHAGGVNHIIKRK